MYIVRSIPLTPTSASEAEDDAPVWDALTEFDLGDFTIESGVLYVSSIDGNLGYPPSDEVQELEGARWIRVGATNVRRFLDGIRSSETTGDSPLVLEVEAGKNFNAICLFGLQALETKIEVISGAQVMDTRWVRSGPVPVDNYWDLRNTEFYPVQRRHVISNIAGFSGATIRLTLTGPNPTLGLLIVGKSVRVGDTRFDARTRIRRKTFTTITNSTFGEAEATKRATAHDTSYLVVIEQAGFHGIDLLLDEIDGTKVVTYATADRPELINYGFVMVPELPVEVPKHYEFELVNQGVI